MGFVTDPVPATCVYRVFDPPKLSSQDKNYPPMGQKLAYQAALSSVVKEMVRVWSSATDDMPVASFEIVLIRLRDKVAKMFDRRISFLAASGDPTVRK